MNQRIVCAAIMNKEGEICCAPRHYDKLMNSRLRDSDQIWISAKQGFVDQFGTFLTREDAWVIAKGNGQIIRRCGGDEGKLFSENLY